MEVTEMEEITDNERRNKDAAGNFHSKCDDGEQQLDCGAEEERHDDLVGVLDITHALLPLILAAAEE